MIEQPPSKMVRTVERALHILFGIASAPAPMTLSEISARIDVDKATALRLLGTLETFRLVERDRASRRYTVGAAVWQLGRTRQADLRSIARPHLEALRNATAESVLLVVRRGGDRVVLVSVEAEQEFRVVPNVNKVVPVYSGASGKVLMAFMPTTERGRIIETTGLKPVVERGMIDRKSFLASLDEVRRDGFATSGGDVTLGVASIAAPVLDSGGAVRAVVSVRGPEVRLNAQRMARIAPLVVEAADAIALEMFAAPGRA